MKQTEYCPFVKNKEPQCETPPCDSCYLNCIHKPHDLKGGNVNE